MSSQIPSTAGIDQSIRRILDPLKENIEVMRGRRVAKINVLPAAATNTEIIAKINEIINRMQG